MKFGVQNSVIGWDDPWHTESCKTMMRTGEGAYFPAQDPMPSKPEFLRAVESLGADFLVQSVMPVESEIERFLEDMRKSRLGFLMNNEFGGINLRFTEGNRHDIPRRIVELAKKNPRFLGLVYDETEHLQINNTIYGNTEGYQWVDPAGKTLEENERELVRSVSRTVSACGCDVYGEVLFGTLYHALNRGGMLLSAKLLNLVRHPLQLAVTLGAARQYRKKLMWTVDLWGCDLGGWFTRLWGLPGHGPKEFSSALELGFLTGAEMMFVENCDPLMQSDENRIHLTEFGELYRDFISAKRNLEPAYRACEAECEIAVIRSEDGWMSKKGTFFGKGPYGSPTLAGDDGTNSFFDVMHVLSRGTISELGTTMHLTDGEFPHLSLPRDAETLKRFPLETSGHAETNCHKLFYPMPSTLVFDSHADGACLRECGCVVVCGSRLDEDCAAAVRQKAESGATVIAASRFKSQLGAGITYVDDFLSGTFEEAISPFLSREDEWILRFPGTRIVVTNPNGDGNSLSFSVTDEEGKR